jgi:hypothetical protein
MFRRSCEGPYSLRFIDDEHNITGWRRLPALANADACSRRILPSVPELCCHAMQRNPAAGKVKHLNGNVFPQPPLVWHVWEGSLRIRSLVDNKHPQADTRLAIAPFWNLSHNWSVCAGSMRRPESASVAAISSWEQGFYESNFTHSNVGRLTVIRAVRRTVERSREPARDAPERLTHRTTRDTDSIHPGGPTIAMHVETQMASSPPGDMDLAVVSRSD